MPFNASPFGWQESRAGSAFRHLLRTRIMSQGRWFQQQSCCWILAAYLEAKMKFLSACLLIFPGLLCVTGCGGNMMTNTTTTRQLQTITVTPAAAIAQSTSRQVQFTPMGSYNMAPMSAMPQVMWSVGTPSSSMPMPMSMGSTMITPPGVTINQNGLASCSTFSGMVTVQATSSTDPSATLTQMAGMMTSTVVGSAQLTCP